MKLGPWAQWAAVALLLRPPPGDIVSQVENAILSFFQTIWASIVGFFGQIGQALTNLVTSIFEAPISAINSSWVTFQSSIAGTGPLAPILTILVVVAVVIIVVFVIWLIIKLSVSEGEQTASEAEEGV